MIRLSLKCILCVAFATVVMITKAQEVVEYTIDTPGTLSNCIAAEQRDVVQEIKIKGKVDARDIFFMRDSLSAVDDIDMSQATIEGVNIDGVVYEANTIPEEAFGYPLKGTGKRRLKSFLFPLNTQAIGNNAFYMCILLRETNINELAELQYIGDAAFSRCARIRSVVIPVSVTEIGSAAFASCALLAQVSINEYSQLQYIGTRAFSDCANLKEIDLSMATQLQEIGERAFASCSTLAAISLPSSVTYIGNAAFMYTALSTIDWSHLHNLDTIEGSMFYGASLLNKVVLPHYITEIKASVFVDCHSLKTVELPYYLAAIGDWAFSGCDNLAAIYCPAQEVPMVGYAAFEGVTQSAVKVSVDEQLLSQYRENTTWNAFELEGVYVAGSKTIADDKSYMYMQGNVLHIETAEEMSQIAVYDYNGSLVAQLYPDSTTVAVQLPTKLRHIVRIVYADGRVEVMK